MPSIWEDVLDGRWGCAILPGTAHTACYQERTGASATTPATADGDPVGTIHDLISGLYITMGSDGSRPSFRTSAGVSWLQFDGTDDILVAFPGAYTGTVIYGVALLRDTNEVIVSVTKDTAEEWNSNSRVLLMGRGGAACQLYRNGILRGFEYPGSGVDYVMEAQSGATATFVARDGDADLDTTHGDAGSYDVNRVGFFCQGNGASPSAGRLYGALVVGAAPTSGERADLVTAAQALLEGGSTGEADGALLGVAASLVAGEASGVRSPTVSGQVLGATVSVIEGAATGERAPTVPGATLAAEVSLVAEAASGSLAPTVPGQILGVASSLVAGAAAGARSPEVAGQALVVGILALAGTATGGGAVVESRREQVLRALLAALQAARPAGTTVLRNATLPERIPAAGLMILRDGDPGEPEFLFSPARYFYEHRAEVEVIVDAAPPAARDAVFDGLARAIARALEADRTLGGLVDFALGEAPAPLDLPIEGAAGLKAASIGVILPYDTGDPLA